jgi:alkanesulfonate monooxygenase SsuD/methylene tetrahydromethanopterin reductase-like flavin-dependent oxidoreductase (luciferase family)
MTSQMETAQRPVGRTGVALRDPWAWHELSELATTAEETGYAALFLPEIAGREAFSTLAALAGVTSEIELGTGVVTMVSRQPLVTAMAAATVDERSGGRLVLGLGTGPPGRGALEALRALVESSRRLLSGDAVESASGTIRLSMPPAPGRRIPIWIAALGPIAMRLAGEVADGVILNWTTPERVAFARERVREGAEAAGRDPASVVIAAYVRACLGCDEEQALSALRRAAGEYARIPAYARAFAAAGLGEQARTAASAAEARSAEEVPAALVRSVCLLGDPDDAASRLSAYREAGADLPIVYPVPCLDPLSSVLSTLFALAPDPALAP